MFSKKEKLPLPQDRNRLRSTLSGEYFSVKTADNEEGHNRFAIIIPARAVKKSTARHFWKRRLSELLRRWPNLKKDFLFIVSSRIEKAGKEDLKKETEKIFKIIDRRSP